MADRAVCIGPPPASESYLQVRTIVSAALGTGSDAIHPGYGFLAEQSALPDACIEYGLIFIGPRADHIRKMGDKILARKMAEELNIPVIPGTETVQNLRDGMAAGEKLGFPVLLKAAAGGGGKGMKVVSTPQELSKVFDAASAEAGAAFGDGRLYVEHFIPNARHIEVQIVGDKLGNLVHLGERDCTLQRRYQKLLEEAPSPAVSCSLREEICKAALTISKHIGYESVGTIEFMLDQDEERFYFLEMNTRIQVEHPVTETITGIDLVREQIRVADGLPLSFSQGDVAIKGHGIECRVNAESPTNGFAPSPGRIFQWKAPSGPKIRVDSHCYSGYFVPPYYDSLLAKVIVWGKDRFEAIARMKWCLDEFKCCGIDTNIPFHQFVLAHRDFLCGKVNTRWIENVAIGETGKECGR
jgi:acetyl-CoA carboxylase biotin carboxylase subunit